MANTKPTWKLSADKLTYTKIYSQEETYYTTVEDIYGNKIDVLIEIKKDIANIPLKVTMECKQGEIDIIAKDKNEYVFIEVKTRQNFHYGMPCEAVDERKQKHIWNATRYYIYSHKLEDQYIRIDVIEIYKRKNRFYLHHIKQIK